MKRLFFSFFLLTCVFLKVQGQAVSGTVTSAEGEKLIGVTIQLKGTGAGTATSRCRLLR